MTDATFLASLPEAKLWEIAEMIRAVKAELRRRLGAA